MSRTAFAALLASPLLAIVPVAPAQAGGGCHEGVAGVEVATTTIRVDHACYAPMVARVPVGATVTWNYLGDLKHTISGPAIDYTELGPGAHKITFDRPGVYPYACTLHPGMSGVLLVGPAATVPGAGTVTKVSAGSPSGGDTWTWAAAGAVVLAVTVLVLAGVRRREAYGPTTAGTAAAR